jgi:hypothetical protein
MEETMMEGEMAEDDSMMEEDGAMTDGNSTAG